MEGCVWRVNRSKGVCMEGGDRRKEVGDGGRGVCGGKEIEGRAVCGGRGTDGRAVCGWTR